MATIQATAGSNFMGLVGNITYIYQVSFLNKSHTTEIHFYQPNMIRFRKVFRSPMDSEDLNLEMSLFTYDVFKLYEKVSLIESVLKNDFIDIRDGNNTLWTIMFDGITTNIVTLSNLETIALRLQGYSDRLEILEREV